jgi:threonine dehydrogenase-like Zn-dependent dehydrogenase
VTAVAPGGPVPPVEAVYDTSGVAWAIHQAIPHLRPGGGVVLLGLGDIPLEAESLPVRMRGSFAYQDADFAHSTSLINSGAIRLGDLVTHRFALDRVAEAITAAAAGQDAVKVTVNPSGTQG